MKLELDVDWTLVGKIDYAITEENSSTAKVAEFGEIDLGFAYRPTGDNRLNALAMYSYVYDLDPTNQFGGMYLDEKGHVLSLEAIYHLIPTVKVGAKYALKKSEIRIDRDQSDFLDATTQLIVGRLTVDLMKNLAVFGEYRLLEIEELDDQKQGALVGIDIRLTDHFGLGVGYNFTEFNDRLQTLNYEAKGWFLNFNAEI